MSNPLPAVLPRQYFPYVKRASDRAFEAGKVEGKAEALGKSGMIGLTPIDGSSTGHVLATTVYLQPDHTIGGKAHEIGLLEIRKLILPKFRESEACKKHDTLARQVEAAKKKITTAEDVLRRANAAKELLEANPTEDFAAKLHEVANHATAATTALAAAKLDLSALTKLVPKFFAEAAAKLTEITQAEVAAHVADLGAKSAAATKAKADALDKVREAVQAALTSIYAAPAAEAALFEMAHNRTAGTASLGEKLVGELLGTVPPGVAMLRNRAGAVVIEDAPPAQPVPMDQAAVFSLWSQFLDRLEPLAERTTIRFQRNPTTMAIMLNGREFLLALGHSEQRTPNGTIILEEPGRPLTPRQVVQFNSLGQTTGSADVTGLLLPEQSEDLLLRMLPS